MDQQRIRLTVRYDGTEFAGSQIQPRRRTVAGTLTAELESFLGCPVKLLFAGRTDAGVHADGNVCAFDIQRLPLPVTRLPVVLNRHLPADLRIRDAAVAEPGFHPRFSAVRRSYVYRYWQGQDVPVDRLRFVTSHAEGWDIQRVRAALKLLPGRHDFHVFGRAVQPGAGWCDLQSAVLMEQGREKQLHFAADRFLWQMVRRLCAALAAVAEGRLTLPRFAEAVKGHGEIKLAAAPARGLTLLEVSYD